MMVIYETDSLLLSLYVCFRWINNGEVRAMAIEKNKSRSSEILSNELMSH
jgi:hypothetical protein